MGAQRGISIPNLISISRVLFVPFIMLFLALGKEASQMVAAILFAMAAITDMVDGLIARRYNSVTALGKLIDPLADKMLVCLTLIMLVSLGRAPGWVAAVIVGRELLVTGMRGVMSMDGKVISARASGKVKAVTQYVAIFSLCIHEHLFGIPFGTIGNVLLVVALVLTVYSGAKLLFGALRGIGD